MYLLQLPVFGLRRVPRCISHAQRLCMMSIFCCLFWIDLSPRPGRRLWHLPVPSMGYNTRSCTSFWRRCGSGRTHPSNSRSTDWHQHTHQRQQQGVRNQRRLPYSRMCFKIPSLFTLKNTWSLCHKLRRPCGKHTHFNSEWHRRKERIFFSHIAAPVGMSARLAGRRYLEKQAPNHIWLSYVQKLEDES
jgi:hypothetical protein